MAVFKRLMTEEGVALLSYRTELPEVATEAEDRLLSGILSRALAYLEGDLTQALRREYQDLTEPRKRFTFCRADYRLCIRRQESGALSLSLTLRRGARLLCEWEEAFSVSESGAAIPCDRDGSILAPARMKRIKKMKKRL